MMDYKDIALMVVTLHSHPHKVFRVFSERAYADVMQLWREKLVSVRFTSEGLMFRLTALGQDIARDYSDMQEV